jgi:hypothetical protein
MDGTHGFLMTLAWREGMAMTAWFLPGDQVVVINRDSTAGWVSPWGKKGFDTIYIQHNSHQNPNDITEIEKIYPKVHLENTKDPE